MKIKSVTAFLVSLSLLVFGGQTNRPSTVKPKISNAGPNGVIVTHIPTPGVWYRLYCTQLDKRWPYPSELEYGRGKVGWTNTMIVQAQVVLSNPKLFFYVVEYDGR